MDDVAKRARELVDAATPGSWHTGNQEVRASSAGGLAVAFCGQSTTASGDGFHRIDVEQARANAAFIAASPDLVRGLLAENDRLRTVIYEAARALYDHDEAQGMEELGDICARAYSILDAATPKDGGGT
jgi:hypothetical protein